MQKLKKNLNSVSMRLNGKFMPYRAFGSPQYIQIETTSRCNLKCKMCPNSSDEYYNSKVLKDMTLDEFAFLIGRFPFLKDIALQGLGEPTMNKQLPEMIGLCTSKSISTTFVTNALLLIEELSERIISSGLKHLIVSVDGGEESTFREIRGGNLAKVLQNLRNFITIKDKTGSRTPNVMVMVVGMKANLKEVPAIVDAIKEVGVRHLTVKGINTSFNEELKQERLEKKDSELLREFQASSAESGVVLDVAISPEQDYTNKQIKCRWPWARTNVTVSGDVTPCCHIIDNKHIRLGNLFNESFESIWNSRKYSELRTSVKNKTSPLCKNCPDY